MNYITPVGFRDVMSDEALVREDLTARVRACFAQKGYRPVETPTLEVLDVMEAGGHVPEAPFKFFDSHGDLLAMRPDVTMQIARMCATRGVAQDQPLRLRYTQRVFREKTAEAAARELTQCGAECIGAAGSEADVELVSLLASALSECGLETFTIALGSAGVLRDLLDASGASDQWKTAVMQAYHTSNFVYLEELVIATERAANGGSNEAEDKSRFKLADPAIANPGRVVPAIARAIFSLSRLRGGKAELAQVRAMLEPLGCARGIGELEGVYNALIESGLEGKVLIDFSVMSSFDYYTGLVFEAYAPGLGSPLGGGGRYDNLLAQYGAGNSETRNMQATFCGIGVDENNLLHFFNVGDSRLYRYRNAKMRQLSTDQSLVQMLYKEGTITKEEQKTHAYRHIISPVMGNLSHTPTPDIQHAGERMAYGDVLLLCTDGLSDVVSPSEMEEILALPLPLPRRLERLIALALKKGGKDNVTIVAMVFFEA